MKTKNSLIHFLMIPIITLIVCNPASHELLGFYSLNPAIYLKNIMLLITLLYGLYLGLTLSPKGLHWTALAITGILGFSLSYFGFSGGLWWIAYGFVFSGMRVTILNRPLGSLGKDLMAYFSGVMIATLLTPLSLIASIVSFLLVQMIYEMRLNKDEESYIQDRFQESYRTAERILKEVS